ncbi:ABC transporter permease [Streptomyces sp. YIM 98790]|uniref:ABC transporter permease n=1 Tax=Streptomyces sp. YIM 98790 TaxID=2689077 RepID=UPI001408B8EE|nr:ABC transporter permease [Streptomyces sp. YIM 98790]
MSAQTIAPPRALFTHALRAEWTKLRTLPSTRWSLLAFAVIGVTLSLLISIGNAVAYPEMSAAEQAGFSPLSMSLFGLIFAQLALAVLGISVVTGEYASGMIAPSLAAVPRRSRLLAAKTVAFTGVGLLAGTLTGTGMFLAGQAVFARQNMPHLAPGSWNDPGVVRAVAGVGLYCAALGLLALAIGTLTRHTAGAVGIMVAIIVLVPSLGGALPEAWAQTFDRYWPTNAGLQLVLHSQDGLAPWTGFAVLCAFTTAVLAAAFAAFRRRDI